MYDYDRRSKIADAENVYPYLEGFQRALETMRKKYEELASNPGDAMTSARAMVYVPGVFEVLQKVGKAYRLFWGILQQYKIESAKDRKVIEKASREFAKTKLQKPKQEKALAFLKDKIEEYEEYAVTAERILKKGILHLEEGSDTVEAAGCFQLVNAGGVAPQQMEEGSMVVEEGSNLIRAKGFGKVCYGTVQVTNTVSNKSNEIAFYAISTDELFVRGNLRGKQGVAVDTVIHELGHRLHLKFLKNKDAEIKSLYNALLRGEEEAFRGLVSDKTKWPKPGETYQEGQKTYVAEKVGLNRNNDYIVKVHLEGAPEVTGSLSLAAWLQNKGLKPQTFVTPYAKTNYAENFAEMFEHYVLGTLPDGQVQMFEALL